MGTENRRSPRRVFESNIGLLYQGEYAIERSLQLGEGGLRIYCSRKLMMGDLVVVTVKIPGGSVICIRGFVRYLESNPNKKLTYGISFENLNFIYKRELRNFVALATKNQFVV